jgi:PAS domain S-box-containing protein
MATGILRCRGAGYMGGALGIAVVTAVAAPVHETVNDTAVALTYLLVVLLVATAWGSWAATAASVAGMLCFNFFFLPPLYTFTIADPQNWVALAAFVVTAVTAGQLSDLAKRRAAETEAVRTSARLTATRSRSLLEASLDALLTIGTDGKIDDVNSAIETVTGRSRASLIGTDFSDCFTESERARALYREVLREGFVRDRPLAIRHRDGHVTSVLYNAALHRDETGMNIGVVAAVRSISTSAGRAAIAMSDPEMMRALSRFVVHASLFSIAVGVVSLIGWVLDIGVVKSVIPGGVIIKPNAAIALVLCGMSLWLLRSRGARRPEGIGRRVGQALAAIVTLIGLLSLSEHLFGWDLGIDQGFFLDQDPWEAFGSTRPGLMAPITALDFVLIGLALLILDWTIGSRTERVTPAQFLAFIANTGAIFGLLDFLLASHTSYTHVALQTAIALFVLSFAVACVRTDRGLGALITSSSYGGMLTRRLWPAAIVVPLLIGGASWTAYSLGLVSEWSGITVMIVAMVTLLAGSTVASAQRIDRSDVERRHAEASLHRNEEELREAQRLARMGSWWWEPTTDTVTWSEGLYHIAGRDPKMPPPGLSGHSSFYTAASFARLMDAVRRAAHTGTSFALELDMVRPDGTIRSVTSRGEAERDAGGHVVLVRGTIHDVTEHKRAEDALRESEANLKKAQAIAHIGSWHLDVTHDRLTWSDEVFRIFGVTPDRPLTYESFLASIHPADRNAVINAWAAAMRGAPYDIEHRIVVDGSVKWVRERAEVEFDSDGRAVKGIGTVQDITERKRAQQELVRLNRALRALSLCNGALIRATEESAWLAQICRIIVDEAGYPFCWVGRAEQDEARTVTAVAEAGGGEGYLAHAGITWADTLLGVGPVGTCIRTGQTQIVKDTATDPSFAPWRDEALTRGYASVIAIPLVVEADTFGALTIYAAEADAFGDQELTLLTELASDLAFGMTALRTRAEREDAMA